MILIEYKIIFYYIIFSLALSSIIFGISYLLSYENIDLEKISSYECGFQPFSDARLKFDIKFYLVGILFIIFDLEVSFLFPWVVIIKNLSLFGYYTVFLFLFILIIGFFYEWFKGSLEW
jgi:NADH:ubiquinone oxidoreductase subunit 3 (subunit A)